jgi:hypothetical protein
MWPVWWRLPPCLVDSWQRHSSRSHFGSTGGYHVFFWDKRQSVIHSAISVMANGRGLISLTARQRQVCAGEAPVARRPGGRCLKVSRTVLRDSQLAGTAFCLQVLALFHGGLRLFNSTNHHCSRRRVSGGNRNGRRMVPRWARLGYPDLFRNNRSMSQCRRFRRDRHTLRLRRGGLLPAGVSCFRRRFPQRKEKQNEKV